MRRLYERREVLFAVLWIVAYCFVMTPLRGAFGDGSPWMALALGGFAACITVFVKTNALEQKYGLDGWPKNARKYLWFIPMWILATGNVWDGFDLAYQGASLAFALVTMLLVGYVEEMIFRGFLFRAMLPKSGTRVSIVVVAMTFGIGHIVNLLTGQASFETVVQVLFAVSWGFVLTMVLYKSGSLWPCIVAHGLVDVSSLIGADTVAGDWAYVIATIVVAALYCVFLRSRE